MSLLAHARLVASALLETDRKRARITHVFKGAAEVGQVVELAQTAAADGGSELHVFEHVVPEHRHGEVAAPRFTIAVIDPRHDAFAAGDIERAARSKFRLPPPNAPYLQPANQLGPLYVDFLISCGYPWPLLEKMAEALPDASRELLRFALANRAQLPVEPEEDSETTQAKDSGWYPVVRLAARAVRAALEYPLHALRGDTRAFLYSTWTELAAMYVKPIRFRACTSPLVKLDDRSHWTRNATVAETKAWLDNHQIRWRPCRVRDRTWVPIVHGILLNGEISVIDWPAPHFDDGSPNTPDPRPPGKGGNVDASNWREVLADLRAYNEAGGGGRGKWHSEAATEAHERYHWEQEWIEGCIKRHLPMLLADVARLEVQADTAADARARLEPMMALPISAYTLQCLLQWSSFQQLDEPGKGAGYAAGQAVLDNLIRQIETIAANAGW